MYTIVETFPNVLSETPVRLPMCWDSKTYDGTCTDLHFMYARRCNGHLQFDISFLADYGCSFCLCFGRVWNFYYKTNHLRNETIGTFGHHHHLSDFTLKIHFFNPKRNLNYMYSFSFELFKINFLFGWTALL
jgi:hypothetical protein